MTPTEKLKKYLLNQSDEHLLTIDEYNQLSAHDKGVCVYLQYERSPELKSLGTKNPYPENSEEFLKFNEGLFIGTICN